jgi:hypothetical protein
MGRGHLSANRLKEALHTFAEIVREYPADPEAYVVLGDLYLAGEKFAVALNLYQSAISLDPENNELSNRIGLARAEGKDDRSTIDPTAVSSLDLLYNALEGNSEQLVNQDVDEATKLLDEIIHSSNPAELVARHLDQIENLLPALLELNIRQAKMEKRPDLASSLENLQKAIHHGGNWAPSGMGGKRLEEDGPGEDFAGKVTVLVPDRNQPSVRAAFISECLSAYGCMCTYNDESDIPGDMQPDIVIACNPHINPWLLEYMAMKTAQKIPIILDLDKNFEEMPVYYPDYIKIGLGSPANARAYSAALLLSNLITVPSQEFANRLSEMGYNARVIPDGWSRSNSLWDRSPQPRNTINIGWLGNTGLLEDLIEIRRIIIRVIREFPRTQLVVTENSQAFQLFGSLPDNRKLFIPEVSMEDHPYLLGQLDILVAPLKNLPFNITQPDTILMEAGVKRLAWVASRIPAFSAWNNGGLLADTLEEWHTNLRQLVMDGEMRAKLGDAGCRKAQQREMQLLKGMWIDAANEVVRDPTIRGLRIPVINSLNTEGYA